MQVFLIQCNLYFLSILLQIDIRRCPIAWQWGMLVVFCEFNSLWPSDAIWRQRSESTLDRVMLVSWWHKAITWTNVDSSSVRSILMHSRAIPIRYLSYQSLNFAWKFLITNFIQRMNYSITHKLCTSLIFFSLVKYQQIIPGSIRMSVSVLGQSYNWPNASENNSEHHI